MEISRDTPKNSQKLFLNLFKTLMKEANIEINEIPAIKLIKREQPVTQYPSSTLANLENRIFTQYFCNYDTITIKGEGRSKYGCVVKIKETCNISKTAFFSEQFNFRIPLNQKSQDTSLDCKIGNHDIKVVVNHGLKQYKGLKLFFHQAFGHQRGSRNYNFKLGLAALWNNLGCDSRIKIDQDKNIVLYSKFVAEKDMFKFGMIGVFELKKRYIANKILYLGYNNPNLQIHLKAQQAFARRTMNYKDIKQWFSLVSATSVYRFRQTTRFGLQVNLFPQNNSKILTSILYEYTDKNRKSKYASKSTMYKLKLDSLLTVTGLVRHQYNSKFTFSLGCKLPFYDKLDSSKLGVRFDINM